jgi:predicted N-acetyltransferase YhbS
VSPFDGPRPLLGDDPISDFRCGEPELDHWLVEKALKAEAAKTARTYVVTEVASGKVAGYYCLSAHSISRAEIGGGRLARNTPDPVPVILLGRLAVDTAFQDAGLGSALLKDALVRTIAAAQAIGARALIVHTINDEVAGFYVRWGFRAVPANPRTLFLALDRLLE